MFTETLTSRDLIEASRDRLARQRMASYGAHNPGAFMDIAQQQERHFLWADYRYMARVRALRLDPRRLP